MDQHELSPQEMGRRLRIAREDAGIRQEDAANHIGLSRPTVVAIEKGLRPARIQEIQKLAQYYGISANTLLRGAAVHADLTPRFRKLRETEDAHASEAVRVFTKLIKADIEMENLLGIRRELRYPTEVGIGRGDVVRLAEKHAADLRAWLGIGTGPISDIFATIELDLGIRLYQRRLASNSKVAGLFTYDEEIGACILLNANHPLPRRVQSAAHELGHFYATRRMPEVLEEDEQFLSRDERYASAFGRALLAPAESFSESFYRLRAITGKITRRLIVLLAHQYNLSRQACTLRLEELGLAKKGTWAWFQDNGGITDQHALEVLGEVAHAHDPTRSDADRPISHRMSLMVHAVWKRELMSEGQLAELLDLDRVQVRTIVDQIELEETSTDDSFQFLG